MRNLRCYPYEIQRHHELLFRVPGACLPKVVGSLLLLPADFLKRRSFAVWAFQKIVEDDDWLYNVLWADESLFTLQGHSL